MSTTDIKEPVLEVRDIVKTFGSVQANRGISFDVYRGEILGVIGPNGCGKSTLFNCILGQVKPDSGTVKLCGQDVTGQSPPKLSRAGMGRTFQLLQVFDSMRVPDNLLTSIQAHVGSVLGTLFKPPDLGMKDKVDSVVESFRLSHVYREEAARLSYGQQKLLDIAMGLMAGPQIVFLDEPAGGVNLSMLAGVKERILELNRKEGMTFAIIEHNMEFIFEVADRILVLADGQVLMTGTAAEVRHDPRVIEAYLGANVEIVLRTREIVVGYGQTTILNGTSIQVPKSALTTVIGPNGAGKSTLFKALFGMLPVRTGTIELDGQNITGLQPLKLLQLGMAYVPQGRNLFSQLTVEHNLEFGGVSLRNLGETRRRMEKVYEQFPILKERRKMQAGTLSGGEQKMLEIGRAMLLDPKVLLIDEPSIGLSPILVQQTFELLQNLRDKGVTILMIEQNAKKALAVSDYAIVLQQGRLAMDGTASGVLNHPEIGHLFLGGVVQVEGIS